MGWFIGIAGRDQSLKNSILSLTSSNDFNVESESFFLLAGGHHQTTHYQLDEDQKAGWVASGIGISTGEEPKLYDLDDWDQAIGKGVNHLHQINGHFAVCRWDDQQVELITASWECEMHLFTGQKILFFFLPDSTGLKNLFHRPPSIGKNLEAVG